ncbi:MAG: class I SAM-dependent methyltransferase [Fimbriimonadaceae bacterium]|nr:methyltransferase domain-containing protein [Chthonomonadaceae bacterium]MCO5296228.1 class I SAM-dependent methyltransferase [Fimbriimonadaceae bacterium]
MFEQFLELGIGTEGQRLLDLGTGTGVMARQFARQGALVSGVDVSPEQIAMAGQLAAEEGLEVEFLPHPAEALPWSGPTFDVATANQCWLYFDRERVVAELRRVLKPGGKLVTSHFSWLPRLDAIARRSEQLVLEFNPDWSAADWSGDVPKVPSWAEPEFEVEAMFVYDEPIAFTRESWRGRFRACRGVGAVLSESEVEAFDAAHHALLHGTAPESFTVLHRLDAHVLKPRPRSNWVSSRGMVPH